MYSLPELLKMADGISTDAAEEAKVEVEKDKTKKPFSDISSSDQADLDLVTKKAQAGRMLAQYGVHAPPGRLMPDVRELVSMGFPKGFVKGVGKQAPPVGKVVSPVNDPMAATRVKGKYLAASYDEGYADTLARFGFRKDAGFGQMISKGLGTAGGFFKSMGQKIMGKPAMPPSVKHIGGFNPNATMWQGPGGAQMVGSRFSGGSAQVGGVQPFNPRASMWRGPGGTQMSSPRFGKGSLS